MTITFECPNCHAAQRPEIAAEQQSIRCPECSHEIELRAGAIADSAVTLCPLCATADVYVQKDFPHRLGLTIVVIGTLLSSVAWYHYKYPLAIAILLATALLDLCLYYAIGDVLVCYRCLAQIRGTKRRPDHRPFDLGVGERYRQERIRLDLLRRSSGHPPGPPSREPQ